MFGVGPATRIYLAAGATDMRKGFEGLYGLVRDRQLRTSMRCQASRGNGESFSAEVWFSAFKEGGVPKLAAIIVDVSEEQSATISVSSEPGAELLPVFNQRQIAVLRMVFEGLTNPEIAARLDMTPSAVKNVLKQIFSQAGAKNRSQMVRITLERYRDIL